MFQVGGTYFNSQRSKVELIGQSGRWLWSRKGNWYDAETGRYAWRQKDGVLLVLEDSTRNLRIL